MTLHLQEWGQGHPLIALHPLALESTAFAGVARLLARRGLRTLAVDLPGFGRTPAPDEPPTPECLARPVIELARSLETPPLLLGMSMGGRVALEAALLEPGAFRGVVAVAPYLPWREHRWAMRLARHMNPDWAAYLPIERAWPVLKHATAAIEAIPRLENDWLARACVRVVYYSTCSVTRVSLLSGARELALDPAFGARGLWTRLARLELPAAFLWAGQDRLIPGDHAGHVADLLPESAWLEVPCSGHFVNGAHYRCMEHAMTLAVERALEEESRRERGAPAPSDLGARTLAPCLAAKPERIGSRVPRTTDQEVEMSDSQNERRNGMRRLTGQDAVFVYAETPTMPMHTMGTTILDPSRFSPGEFSYARIVDTIASRVHLMPPFRQRLLTIPLGLGHPMLVDDPDFRVENHVHRIAVPAPGTMRELAPIVADIGAALLPRSQPLWEMWIAEGMVGGRIALITKMHHCMIDGASGSSQMAQLMDLEPDAVAPEPAKPWRPQPLPSALELARMSAGDRLVDPRWLGRLLFKTARGVVQRRSALREILPPGEPLPDVLAPPSRFNHALTRRRSVAYGSAPLADVKRIKNAFGVTVNDVVLAACTLCLRRYLLSHGDRSAQALVAMVPVSVKSAQEKEEFSNKVSSMMVSLPAHLDAAEDVVQAVHVETTNAKYVFEAIKDDLIPEWLQLLPPLLTTLGARLVSDLKLAEGRPSPANVVISNMVGPPVPLYFGGARVEAVYPMGPVGEGMGVNLTVLSNMGRLDLGVLACRDIVPDVWELAEGFARAVAELLVVAEKKSAQESLSTAGHG